MRIDFLTPQVVELAPKELQPGTLYISLKYKSALHLCCCGCGEKVITPLSPAEWRLRLIDGKATLHPSIGNWSMTCKSHYLIRGNRVIWAGGMSARRIAAVQRRDKADIDAMYRAKRNANTHWKQHHDRVTNTSPPSGSVFERFSKLWHWLSRK